MINKVPEDKHFYFKQLWLKQCEIIDWINKRDEEILTLLQAVKGLQKAFLKSPESTAVNVESRVATKDNYDYNDVISCEMPKNRKGCGKHYEIQSLKTYCRNGQLCEDCKVKE